MPSSSITLPRSRLLKQEAVPIIVSKTPKQIPNVGLPSSATGGNNMQPDGTKQSPRMLRQGGGPGYIHKISIWSGKTTRYERYFGMDLAILNCDEIMIAIPKPSPLSQNFHARYVEGACMHRVWPLNRHKKRQPRVMYHDTTSALYGKGKPQAVQLFNCSKYLQDIPEIFNNSKSTYTDIERAGEVHLRIVQQHEERGK
ncbi:hypothetical protein AVEN_101477-1 [Araneus ventricosus]|uniref:Uncharacterized protein n=1 Tax=Araneus ventricosus TaxID=182803 RepID=A0A4Y2PV76_ARAVE|nr:hypothetical protein AVEN_101477-1 [Araneus ventricosus]